MFYANPSCAILPNSLLVHNKCKDSLLEEKIISFWRYYWSCERGTIAEELWCCQCFRMYYQIIVSIEKVSDMNMVDWWWKVEDTHFNYDPKRLIQKVCSRWFTVIAQQQNTKIFHRQWIMKEYGQVKNFATILDAILKKIFHVKTIVEI